MYNDIVQVLRKQLEVWKCLDCKMHRDVKAEDSASVQRRSIIKSLQLVC